MIAAAALSGLLVGAMASKSIAEEKAVDGSKAEKNKCKGHDKDKCKGHEKSADKNKCKGEAKDKKVGDACSGKDGCNGK
ncbi:hypothetical protein D3C87_1830260 [compost metagenome]